MRLRIGPGAEGPEKKTVLTRFGAVTVERQCFHCASCRLCIFPRDGALGISGESWSPGLLRVAAQFYSETSGRRASALARESLRLSVCPRQIGRKAGKVGGMIQEWEKTETAPLDPDAPAVGAAIDATAVPVRKQELEGRRGKQEDGSARTREVKLAVFFNPGKPDRKTGNARRDPGSVTVTAAIETAACRDTDKELSPFARRLIREAERRGYGRSGRHFAAADGGAWIWNTAGEIFPDAVQILDLYHVLERLSDAAKAVHGPGDLARKRAERWGNLVRAGRTGKVIKSLRSYAERSETAREAAAYFENNRKRMDYPGYLAAGLPVGSGVVEGACRSVVCERLKKSGMFWSVKGANRVLALRCAVESNTFDDFWEYRSEQKKAA